MMNPLRWTLVLRRQPVHLVEGRPEEGRTDAYELICGDCGDDPGLDQRDIPPACGQHGRLQHGQRRPRPRARPGRRCSGWLMGSPGAAARSGGERREGCVSWVLWTARSTPR
jgi:hypothetical protein